MSWGVPKLGTLVEDPVSGGNFTLIEPAGVAQGDLMIACIAYRGNAAITAPAGWSTVATAQNTGDTDATNGIASGVMFYITRGASAPDLVCTRTAGDVVQARVISYSGYSGVYDTGTSRTLAVASATATTASFDTVVANELIVAMVSGGDNYSVSTGFDATDPATASGTTADTTTAPTAGTWILRHLSGTGTGADSTLVIGDAIRATAGATGQISCVLSGIAQQVMVAGAFKVRYATVVLNSPADASSDPDTTPTLDFTGTDPDGDSLEYNVRISGVIDKYSDGNISGYSSFGATTGDHGNGQSFTGTGQTLRAVEFMLANLLGCTGNAVAKIYAHSGAFGTSSVPTGAALAVSDNLDVSTLPTALDYTSSTVLTFSGANQIVLTNGTKYVVSLEYESGSTLSIRLGIDTTSPGHAGNCIIKNSSDVWNALNTTDICFSVDFFVLNKFSASDAGFVNPDTGGDTHPFNSGENIQYTVQAGDALAPETYSWRVRAIDPAGSNSYGEWSATRSFTITVVGSTSESASPSVSSSVSPSTSQSVSSSTSVSTSESVSPSVSSSISPSVSESASSSVSPSASPSASPSTSPSSSVSPSAGIQPLPLVFSRRGMILTHRRYIP